MHEVFRNLKIVACFHYSILLALSKELSTFLLNCLSNILYDFLSFIIFRKVAGGGFRDRVLD